ncbi:MAG: HPr kinase/phosphatase C-terminal domain-containing protein [Rhizobiaceae bacterium]|nr:HPr kinase/phosphatase C-terminal domain-containing protein [Rhizobiaceae bacterium]
MINHHCNVISIEQQGILIEGPSGSGKTSLALGLLERAKLRALKCTFISDDQVMLENRHGSLHAKTPKTIAGKVEIRGFGITEIPFEREAQIQLVAKLVPDNEIERIPEPKTCRILGMEIPSINVPMRHEEHAARIILAWIDQSTAELV